MSYSRDETNLITAKKWSRIKAKENRVRATISSHLINSLHQDLPHNQFITFAKPALPILEASALLRFQKFCRILRDQAKALRQGVSYLWMAGIGARQGYHIHMTLYWPSRDKARLEHHINRFWDVTLRPVLSGAAALKSNCSSVCWKPLIISKQSYENIALYLSAHVSKHIKQPQGRFFGRSILK
jgi:hypothetical protein